MRIEHRLDRQARIACVHHLSHDAERVELLTAAAPVWLPPLQRPGTSGRHLDDSDHSTSLSVPLDVANAMPDTWAGLALSALPDGVGSPADSQIAHVHLYVFDSPTAAPCGFTR